MADPSELSRRPQPLLDDVFMMTDEARKAQRAGLMVDLHAVMPSKDEPQEEEKE